MSVYLQFDSLARNTPYINLNVNGSSLWFPNDFRYNGDTGLIDTNPYIFQYRNGNSQTPSNYKVDYRELNTHDNYKTISYLAHCKEKAENIQFGLEFCTVTIPACTRVLRPDGIVVNIHDEPYIYVRVVNDENDENNKFSTNNPAGDQATFIAWVDRLSIGTTQDNAAGSPPSIPLIDGSTGVWSCVVPQPVVTLPGSYTLNTFRWVVYKSCMQTVTPFNLGAGYWSIRFYDRYGNDLILLENDNDGAGYEEQPITDPNLQTMVLFGITPLYSE